MHYAYFLAPSRMTHDESRTMLKKGHTVIAPEPEVPAWAEQGAEQCDQQREHPDKEHGRSLFLGKCFPREHPFG